VKLASAPAATQPASAQSVSATIDSVGRALAGNQLGATVVGVVRDTGTATYGFGAVDATGALPTRQTRRSRERSDSGAGRVV